MEGRGAKERLYRAFARTAQALASPKLVELIELLAQGEHTVEALALATGMGVANTSAHLQVLARSPLAEVDEVVRDYFVARDALEPVQREELVARAGMGKVVILDVATRLNFEFVTGYVGRPRSEIDAIVEV